MRGAESSTGSTHTCADQLFCIYRRSMCNVSVRRFERIETPPEEACQSGRMGLTANELSPPLQGTGGSNPLASATLVYGSPAEQMNTVMRP